MIPQNLPGQCEKARESPNRLANKLSGQTLYAYTNAGMLYAFDVADPENPAQLWARKIPRVPDPKEIVIDGERIIVHGIGLTEVWKNDARPPAYYQVGNAWKGLECVIVNGDLIYAFNGAASVSKLMVLRMRRPFLIQSGCRWLAIALSPSTKPKRSETKRSGCSQ